MSLTNVQIKSAQPKDKPYKLSDGKGLYLLINPSGSKYWRLKYRYERKEKLLALGVYPTISLLDARKRCIEAKELLAQNIDPMTPRKEFKQEKKRIADISFQQIASEWIDIKRKSWSEGYTKKLIQSFEKNLYPHIGKISIKNIKALELLNVFQIIENRGALVLANKIRQQCAEVFTHALVTGRCEANPCFGLDRSMLKAESKHFAHLSEKKLPLFLSTLVQYEHSSPIIKIAAQLLIITGIRTGELRGAEWSEFDFDSMQWEIPAERMKKRKSHLVPLSRQAIELLKQLYEYTGYYKLAFTGRNDPNKPISEVSIVRMFERMGYKGKVTGHGFRHTMSTILHEQGFNTAHIELQLAHVDKNSIRGTYNHALYLEDRRKMLQWYADHLDGLRAQAKEKIPD